MLFRLGHLAEVVLSTDKIERLLNIKQAFLGRTQERGSRRLCRAGWLSVFSLLKSNANSNCDETGRIESLYISSKKKQSDHILD